MTEIIGIDVSHHQGEMDFRTSLEAGAQFAIVRAGYSAVNSYSPTTDREFRDNIAKLDQLEVMPYGIYWFLTTTANWKEQAEYFADLYLSTTQQLPPFVDVENRYDFNENATILGNFLEYLEELVERVPYIYTRGEYWNSNYASMCPLVSLYDYGLWIARYNESVDHPWEDDPKTDPVCWDDYSIWQYSADGNGKGAEYGAVSRDIDLNRYNGAYGDWYDEFGVALPGDGNVPSPPPEQCEPKIGVVLVNGLRIRSMPTTTRGTIVGKLYKGDKVFVYDEIKDGTSIWFLIVAFGKGPALAGWSAGHWKGNTFIRVRE
jgi:GH25 family lysozyme M1 (1,4-beta-N-acetylmuramidase)